VWQQETDGFFNTTSATGILLSTNSNGRLVLQNVHNQAHDITIAKLT
jgi:hypothetical protein